jgi:hypothetical protein
LADHLRNDLEASLTVDLPAGDYTAQWLNPLNGQVEQTDHMQHGGGQRELHSPRFANDIALRVKRHAN